MPLRSAVVYGGVPIDPQIKELRGGIEILVATPGRLMDHMGQRTVEPRQVEILVLDEGDRMLDMGFIPRHPPHRGPAAEAAARRCSSRRPSRTRSGALGSEFLTIPRSSKWPAATPPPRSVEQVLYPVDRDRKDELLLAPDHRRDHWQQVLVFTRTKLGANRLAS